MKKDIVVPIIFLLIVIITSFVPTISANNRDDIARLKAIEVNQDFSELIPLRDKIIKLYQIDPEGTQFVNFTPTCIAFIKTSSDAYSKIRALNANSRDEDINKIDTDALSENYSMFHVDASDYRAKVSQPQLIDNITAASVMVMEQLNSSFGEKAEEIKGIKNQLELTLAGSRTEYSALQRNYTILQNYSSMVVKRQGLENTYSSSAKKLRNAMIISLLAFTIVGLLIGALISWKWKRRVEYVDLYTRDVKVIHPVLYACAITLVVILVMFVYIYMKGAYSIFSFLV